jgi:hypothetical protein
METIPAMLIYAGIALVILGVLWNIGSKIGLGSLPGDIKIEKENYKIYFPIATSIVISVILSLAFLFLRKLN